MSGMTRTIVTLSGVVQGVGFRYAVLRIAARYAVAGTVRNVRAGERVEIDVEGEAGVVDRFIDDVLAQPPSSARVDRVERRNAEPRGPHGFSDAPTV
jgi:acylphosphatase